MPSRPMPHVVITGGSSGLGAALAMTYAQHEHRVTLIARNVTRLQAVSDACARIDGARPTWHSCDVTEGRLLGELLATIDAEAPITTIIANAGIGGRDVLSGPLGGSANSASHIVSVNLLGVVNTLTPVIPQMASRRSGRLAIIASIAAFTPLAEAPAYAASKAAVYSYGHGLRRLLRPSGITVTVVSPGFVDTPMSRSLPFARPFLVSTERASRLIFRAVEGGRPEVIFPWPLRVAAAFQSILPQNISDRLLAAGARSTQRTR